MTVLRIDGPVAAAPPLPPSRRSEIDAFKVMDVMRAAAAKEAAGDRVIHMEVGQPGTPAPRRAVEAVERAMRADTLGYTLALGLPQLRERIAAHYRAFYGVSVDPARVVVTTGSSAGFLLAFLSALDHGDTILLPTPGYPCYLNIALALGLKPAFLTSGPENRWSVQPEGLTDAVRRSGAKALLVASPNNPTGTMLAPDRLHALADACRAERIRLISDEIYHGLNFDVPARTAIAFDDDAIVINSFSKYFSMTGWRIGWMVVPSALVRTVERLAQNFFICPPTVSQHAALAAFEATEELECHKRVYARNRDMLLDALPKLGFDCSVPADGAFYLYAGTARLAESATQFARAMLDEAGIAATAGADFHVRGDWPVLGGTANAPDSLRAEQYIRFSFSRTEAEVAEGIRRLQAWSRLAAARR
jgi:aspartate/methionine/tyrosine aminotransferase